MSDLFPEAYQDSPRVIARRRFDAILKRYKELHRIWTHESEDAEPKWTAFAHEYAIQKIDQVEFTDAEKEDPVEMIAGWADLLDAFGLMRYGDTEADAVIDLARLWDFPMWRNLLAIWEDCK